MKERRIIFLLIFLAVALPLVLKINFPNQVSPEVQKFYEVAEALPETSIVVVSFDHEASTIAEIKPLATALLRHIFSRNIRVISLSLLAEGTTLGNQILESVAKEYDKKYGQDYVYLGFRPQYTATILGLGESIEQVFPQDFRGTPSTEIPLLQKVKNYQNVELIFSVADGDMPTYWINYANARYQKNVAILVTAVMAVSYYPFLSSSQILGLVGGLKGAAEYEILLSKPGLGSKGMDAQSISHLVIILLVVFGNITYLIHKKGTKR